MFMIRLFGMSLSPCNCTYKVI